MVSASKHVRYHTTQIDYLHFVNQELCGAIMITKFEHVQMIRKWPERFTSKTTSFFVAYGFCDSPTSEVRQKLTVTGAPFQNMMPSPKHQIGKNITAAIRAFKANSPSG